MNKRKVASVTDMHYLKSCSEPAGSGLKLSSAIYSMYFSVFVVVFMVVRCGCALWWCVVVVCCGCVFVVVCL